MNRATLTGNVGRDPEIRVTQSGNRVANFSLATSERWRDKATGERKEATEWHNIIVWNEGLVGVVEKFVRKGSKLLVEGQIKTREYTDKNGVERRATEIVLQGMDSRIELQGEPGNGTRPPPQEEPPAGYTATGGGRSDLDDDIPF